MYIGLGTVVLILVIVLIVMLVRRWRSPTTTQHANEAIRWCGCSTWSPRSLSI